MTDANDDDDKYFNGLEAVRAHMALTVKDTAALVGVSRAGYYKWMKGGKIRPRNRELIKDLLQQIVPLIKNRSWPPENVDRLTSRQRIDYVLALLGN